MDNKNLPKDKARNHGEQVIAFPQRQWGKVVRKANKTLFLLPG
jgi:hypothetical protein